ncbi:MAG: hypothetical protein Q7R97_00440 [Candidatus Daviesbacteria bacterium]|nr:hypothetical protein [Candidatus Daviesbacteria bacterium]
MSEIKNYLFGVIRIEYQTEADQLTALATIVRKKQAFEIESGYRRSDSTGNFLLAVAHGGYIHDESIVKQAGFKSRLIGLLWWRRTGLLPLNLPDEFGRKYLQNSYCVDDS